MKIKSIKLTNAQRIQESKRHVPIGFSAPVYQIEYEETTPTGLKATGTMEIDTDLEEKISSFFSDLEASLTNDSNVSEETGEEAELHEGECVIPKDLISNIFNITMNTPSDTDVDKFTKDMIKLLNKAFKNLN
ncbi:hypothetical protein [Sporosarcina sp. FSL W7-1283]|uniref:hypothetical protein n=1 Tax=Sporosarcina sp. FSL W7-1283 TaxID=2921560 RepID=UPI0030FCF4B6